MAAKPRATVILSKDNAFSLSTGCNILYGQETIDRNGDKMIYVDEVVPLQENNIKGMHSKYTLNKDSVMNSRRSRFILGFVFNNNIVNREILLEVLKQEFQFEIFCLVSVDEIFTGKSLVIPYSNDSQISRQTHTCNITSMPKVEVRIVCLKRNLSLSNLSWLHSVDWDQTTGSREKLSNMCNLNGILRDHQAHTTDTANGTRRNEGHRSRSAFKLLFLSISWLLNLILTSIKFPTIFTQLLSLLPKYLFVAKQLVYRFDQIYNMFVDKQEIHQQDSKHCSKDISNGNVVVSLLIDIILGFLVIYFVFSNQHCMYISSWLIGQKYNIAEHLSSLLKWLMGAPAGLKLNIPLNQFLGNFYTYHVYLWTNYLYFIESYLPMIILCCTLAGGLGVTFLLALLCDVLLLLTVHIYCFYIYAARLFCLEIHVLASLLRLFTGKKWNFLRSRVDSVEYDVDRLFIGTLLFTIVLFLFPTVLLYYIVFASLRLLVLITQSFLYGVVALLNSFPFFALWLYFVKPERLPGIIVVNAKALTCTSGNLVPKDVHVSQPDSCLYLSFEYKCLPLGNLFTNCSSVMVETIYRDIFGEGIFKKLLTGQIISKPN